MQINNLPKKYARTEGLAEVAEVAGSWPPVLQAWHIYGTPALSTRLHRSAVLCQYSP